MPYSVARVEDGEEPRSGPALGPVGTTSSRAQLVFRQIRMAILNGELVPGEALVERELAKTLGVSKTPVREALMMLRGSGLVLSDTHHSMIVRPVTPTLVRDVYEARSVAEPFAIRKAARWIDEALLVRAKQTLERSDAAARRSDWAEMSLANRQFHRVLYVGCRNREIVRFLDDLQDQVALIATSGWRIKKTWERESSDHTKVLDALHRGDHEAASELMRQHIEKSSRTLEEIFRDTEEGIG